jgi:hypothetical protein
MAPMDPVERQRILRHRHKRERQALIFGTLIAGLAVTAFVAAAIYSGTIPAPFARGFSTAPPPAGSDSPVPCPATGSLPVTYSAVTVTVMNGTKRPGLAATGAAELSGRGFTVAATGNYTGAVEGSARIVFGVSGLAAAYTVAAQFDKPELVLDARQEPTVDVVLGAQYTALLATTAVTLAPDVPLVGVAGCVPVDEITPAPVPTPTPSTPAAAPAAAGVAVPDASGTAR